MFLAHRLAVLACPLLILSRAACTPSTAHQSDKPLSSGLSASVPDGKRE